jgi:hypothetical protein
MRVIITGNDFLNRTPIAQEIIARIDKKKIASNSKVSTQQRKQDRLQNGRKSLPAILTMSRTYKDYKQ